MSGCISSQGILARFCDDFQKMQHFDKVNFPVLCKIEKLRKTLCFSEVLWTQGQTSEKKDAGYLEANFSSGFEGQWLMKGNNLLQIFEPRESTFNGEDIENGDFLQLLSSSPSMEGRCRVIESGWIIYTFFVLSTTFLRVFVLQALWETKTRLARE